MIWRDDAHSNGHGWTNSERTKDGESETFSGGKRGMD